MAIWMFDTPVDEEFPIYTRGNVGEVFPDVVSPLTFSLNSQMLERGWRRLWSEGHIIERTDHPFRITGIFGGYDYLNLSIMRRAADLSPGTSPDEIDHQFFATGVTLPPYIEPDDPKWEEKKQLVYKWIESLMLDPPIAMVEADRTMAFEIRERFHEKRPSAQDYTLLTNMRQLAERVEVLFYTHIATSGMSSVAFGALQQGLRERLGDEGNELARRAVSGMGDVDSAEPAAAIARLATLQGEEYEKGFKDYLKSYGFRGANEWELATPSWELVPEVVHDLVAGARGAEQKSSASDLRMETVNDIGAKVTDWPELPFWIPTAQWYVSARERTKTNCIAIVNEQRLDANELAKRLVDRGTIQTTEDVFMMTIDELEEAVTLGRVPEDLAERGKLYQELKGRTPPLLIVGEVPPLDQWELRDTAKTHEETTELTGVAGSPGKATGRARIVRNPYSSALKPGEILVAPITDPGWTPLFVPASAVVVEVGGELSHAVIVARELGIPAVVAAAGATTSLKDGDLIEVDGSKGVVKVLERA